MNAENIIKALSNKNALSAKGIAHACKVDADAAELIRIQDACWELCNQGVLVAIDRRDQKNGGLFFMASA